MVTAEIKFVLQDMWIGLYWKSGRCTEFGTKTQEYVKTDLYLCVLPCIPIHITIRNDIKGKRTSQKTTGRRN